MKKSSDKIKGSIKENVNLMATPLMSILPGQISFFVILSIIPLASVLMMIFSKLSFNLDTITNFLNHYLPSGVAPVILLIYNEQSAGAIDVIFIITAFYLAAKATHSIIIASTQIYNGEQQDFVRTRVKAIIMLFILIALVVLMVFVLTIGGRVISYLLEVNGTIHPVIFWIYTCLKWPFAFFMVFVTIKVIYTIAPNVQIQSRSVNKGALLTTVVWILSTVVYSFYVSNLANYTRFYGSLSSLIISMIWIYWLCYTFVFGMTINEYRLAKK